MADPHVPDPVLLVIAMFSQHDAALDWARVHLEQDFGKIALSSPTFDFNQTAYYEPTMGPRLRKQLLAFRDLVLPDSLPMIKLRTNKIEQQLTEAGSYREPRPINLDPGLLSLGKFSLATTKDQAHRVYLRDGIFAESTLRFEEGNFVPWPWTYADYRQALVVGFLNEARDFYRQRRRQGTSDV
jgi:hypothetical protein